MHDGVIIPHMIRMIILVVNPPVQHIIVGLKVRFGCFYAFFIDL